ncbi:thiamine pyrophosphate-binding protein [Streptomyces sp. NPDC002454]
MTHDHHGPELLPTPAQTEAALNPPAGRRGADLVLETLDCLGATTVFGVPGRDTLALYDALRRSHLPYVGLRTAAGAAFAADAYGRRTGEAAPLLLPTGPAALAALPALQEAAAASAPVIAVVSQVPAAGLGGARHGHLHELRDQQASFRDVVKSVHTARTPAQIPSAVAAAWQSALTVPHGPVLVEIPRDVLAEPTVIPVVTSLDAMPEDVVPRPELTAVAAEWLSTADRPAIIAGGGVIRSDATGKLRALAEKLTAPVVTTVGGQGAFPRHHPLSLRSHLTARPVLDLLEDADVLLVVGSGLGELTTGGGGFHPRGRIVQIEADPGKLESHHPALGIHADARLALDALLDTVRPRPDDTAAASAQASDRVREALAAVAGTRAGNFAHPSEPAPEEALLDAVRRALPDAAPSFWDLTVLTGWAWSAFDARRPNTLHSAQGAGAPGYALPAAIGAAVADPSHPVLAVSGDGGALHSVAELATARQYGLDLTWLIVDDSGHGYLRHQLAENYAGPVAAAPLDAPGPDLVALAASFGVTAASASPETLGTVLGEALGAAGPSVVVLRVGAGELGVL